jgi:hypothetical protein
MKEEKKIDINVHVFEWFWVVGWMFTMGILNYFELHASGEIISSVFIWPYLLGKFLGGF